MATKTPIILTDSYQAITQLPSNLDISRLAEVEYYTGATSTPAGGTMRAVGGLVHPGCNIGDTLFMKTNTALYGSKVAVVVNEVGDRRSKTSAMPFDVQAVINGNKFTYSTDFTLAASGVVYFLLRVGAVDTMITVIGIKVTGAEVEALGYTGSTVSADGTPVAIINVNAQSVKVPLMTMFQDPTVTTDGNLVARDVAYGGTIVASESVFETAILNQNSDNLLKITNRDGVAEVKVAVSLSFIEGY
jgi:hypothetical protein